MSVDDIESCAYHNWPDELKARAMPTAVYEVPAAVFSFLKEDGIDTSVLKHPDHPVSLFLGSIPWGPQGSFIKLDWSAPTDADWLAGDMLVKNAEAALVLLKGSDKVSHDIYDPYYGRGPLRRLPHLLVRPFRKVDQSREARVLVRGGEMKAACPRHPLVTEDLLPHCRHAISELVSHLPLIDCAVDLYFPSKAKTRYTLMDIAPLEHADHTMVKQHHMDAPEAEYVQAANAEELPMRPRDNYFPLEVTMGLITGDTSEMIRSLREACRKMNKEAPSDAPK